MRFFELLPAVERAHGATRAVVPRTGCQLGASLLALDLGRLGMQPEYVKGRYSLLLQQDHWWVEVDDLLLDPTRDQFSEDPFSETYAGEYVRIDSKPASDMTQEATTHLRLHWSTNRRARDVIRQVATQYGLDLGRISEPLGPLTVAGSES